MDQNSPTTPTGDKPPQEPSTNAAPVNPNVSSTPVNQAQAQPVVSVGNDVSPDASGVASAPQSPPAQPVFQPQVIQPSGSATVAEPQPGPASPASQTAATTPVAPTATTPPPPTNDTAMQPSQQPQPQSQAQPQNPLSASGGENPSKNHKLPLVIAAVALVVLGAAGFVFGYYLPNQPENVYSTGLERSGDVLHELIVEATEAEQLERLSRTQVSATLEVESDFGNFEGLVTSQFDEAKSNSTFSFESSDDDGDDYALSGAVLTNLAEGARFPDIYFQLNGLSALGLDAFLPGISQYDGRWISVSGSYLESEFGDELEQFEITEHQATHDDYAALIRALSERNKEYVFTDNQDKSIFQLEEILGEEEFDGINTYRYLISINTKQLINYCEDVSETIWHSEVYAKLSSQTEAERDASLEDAKQDCRDIDEEAINEDYRYDMWMDRRTKLIHKIRVSDSDNHEEYIEIGQRYQGGDTIELFVYGVNPDDEAEYHLTLTSNTQTNLSTAELLIAGTGDKSNNTFRLSLEAQPHTDEIQADPPANAVPIETILEEFGLTQTQTQTLGAQTDDQFMADDPAVVAEEPGDASSDTPSFIELLQGFLR